MLTCAKHVCNRSFKCILHSRSITRGFQLRRHSFSVLHLGNYFTTQLVNSFRRYYYNDTGRYSVSSSQRRLFLVGTAIVNPILGINAYSPPFYFPSRNLGDNGFLTSDASHIAASHAYKEACDYDTDSPPIRGNK